MNKIRIVVVGGAHTDRVVRVARLPAPGETELGGAFSMAAGGKGANQALVAARAGGAVTLVACLGRDMFGEQALAGLQTDRSDIGPPVDASNVKRDIEHALHRSWFYDPDTIRVAVNGGKMTLSGSVST